MHALDIWKTYVNLCKLWLALEKRHNCRKQSFRRSSACRRHFQRSWKRSKIYDFRQAEDKQRLNVENQRFSTVFSFAENVFSLSKIIDFRQAEDIKECRKSSWISFVILWLQKLSKAKLSSNVENQRFSTVENLWFSTWFLHAEDIFSEAENGRKSSWIFRLFDNVFCMQKTVESFAFDRGFSTK